MPALPIRLSLSSHPSYPLIEIPFLTFHSQTSLYPPRVRRVYDCLLRCSSPAVTRAELHRPSLLPITELGASLSDNLPSFLVRLRAFTSPTTTSFSLSQEAHNIQSTLTSKGSAQCYLVSERSGDTLFISLILHHGDSRIPSCQRLH